MLKVCIQCNDGLATGMLQAGIESRFLPELPGKYYPFYLRGGGMSGIDQTGCIVCRAIVHNDNLKIRVVQLAIRGDGLSNILFLISGGDNNGNQWPIGWFRR